MADKIDYDGMLDELEQERAADVQADGADGLPTKEQFEKLARATYALHQIHKSTKGELKEAREQLERMEKDIHGDPKKRKLEMKDHMLATDDMIRADINVDRDGLDDEDYTPVQRVLHDTRAIKRVEAGRESEGDWNRVQFMEAWDRLFHLATYLRACDKIGSGYRASKLRELAPKSFKRFMHFGTATIPEFERVMATDVELANVIATDFSSRLVEKMRLALKVSALFEQIQQPTPTFNLPLEGGDLTAYLQAELTAADADESTYKWPLSTSALGKVQMVAKKSAVRSLYSDEADEDAMIAVLPYSQKKHGLAHAVAEENGVINGQATADIDTGDAPGATDFRSAWDGLRYQATQNKATTYDISTLTIGKIHAQRLLMGKYGYDVAQLKYITSLTGLFALMSLPQTLTMDLIGPQAVIVKGMMADLESIPVVVSEYMSAAQNASGIIDGAGDSVYTGLLLVNTDYYLRGEKKGYTLKVLKEHYAAQGAVGVISYQRRSFVELTGSNAEKTVSYGVKMS